MQQVVEYQLFHLQPVGIASASRTLFFSVRTGIVKKLLNIRRKKPKNMIKFLCWLKVNLIALKV